MLGQANLTIQFEIVDSGATNHSLTLNQLSGLCAKPHIVVSERLTLKTRCSSNMCVVARTAWHLRSYIDIDDHPRTRRC